MWFGDSVSPYEWSDLWLNEGHASWYEFIYAEENGFLEGDTEGYPDDTGYATLDELMKAVYAHGDEWRAESGPVARRRRAPTRCSPSSATTAARSCSTRCARRSATPPSSASSAPTSTASATARSSTDDFIALAAQVSGRRDVVPFLRDWVYGTKTPPMPGHPDWTVNPGDRSARSRRPNRRRLASNSDRVGRL